MATVRLPEPATQVELNVDNLGVNLDGAQVLAHLYGYDAGGDNWDRVRVVGGGLVLDTELPAAVVAADDLANPTAPFVLSALMGYDGATWDRVPITANGLKVDVAAIVAVNTELPAAALLADDTAIPTAPAVGSFGMMYDGATWDMMRGTAADGLQVNTELPAAAALTDVVANPTTPVIGACLMGYNGATWERVYLTGGAIPVVTQHPEGTLTDGHANPNAVITGSFLMGWNTTTWDRLVSSIANGLEVDVTRVAGTVTVDTELVTIAAADDMANPTVPQVLSHLMLWDSATWDRAPGTSADGLLVNLGANNDVDTELPAAAALSDAFANPTAPAVGSFLMGFDGTDWERLRVTNTGQLHVDLKATALDLMLGTDFSGVFGAASLVSNLGIQVTGDEAHDAVDAGNPIKFGGRAQDPWAQPDEVADDDRVDTLFDRNGYVRVRGDFNPSYAAINCAVSGDNEIVAAQAAGKRIAVWSYFIVSDGTVDARWENGAGGAAFTGQVPLQEREGWVSPAGGLVPLFVGSAATALSLELNAAVNVHGSVSYTVMDD